MGFESVILNKIKETDKSVVAYFEYGTLFLRPVCTYDLEPIFAAIKELTFSRLIISRVVDEIAVDFALENQEEYSPYATANS